MEFTDLDSKWSWLVMVACFAASFVVGGANYSAGLIHATFLDRFGEGQANTAIVGSLHTALMNLAAPLSGMIINRFSVRTALVTSGLLFTSGYLSTAFATSLQMTIFTCGIVSGIGGAIGWTATMVVIGFHFRKYRNLAQGVAVAGTGAGIFGIGPVIQWAGETSGSQGFFTAFACITMHLVLFGVLMRPSQLEIYTQKKRFNASAALLSRTSIESKAPGCVQYMSVITNRAVVTISLSILAFCFGTYIIFLYLPTFCQLRGASPMNASFVLSVSGIASIIGRLLTGAISNWKKNMEVYLFSGSMVLLSGATMLFPLYSGSYSGQMVYAVFLGLFLGCVFVTITPINVSYVGVRNMASALSIELCMGGIGAVSGPVLAGVALDKGTSYDGIFLFGGITVLVAGSCGFITLSATPLMDDTAELEVRIEPEQLELFKHSSDIIQEKPNIDNRLG